MGSNILLIYPPHNKDENTSADVPPLGLAYLASFLKSKISCKVTIWDFNLHKIDEEDFRKKLLQLEEEPDIIGIGGIVTIFNNFLWMSKSCKEAFPDSILIAGGSLASTVPHLLFRYSPVDICVDREGEFTLLEIITCLNNGAHPEDMRHVKGIFLADKGGNSFIATEPRQQAIDLDVFGLPAYDLLNVEEYARNGIKNLSFYRKDLPPQIYSLNNLHMSVITSRGCTERCSFCYRQFPKIGLNSARFVKDHIMGLNARFGINIFTFLDELFNLSENRIKELCTSFMQIKQAIPDFYFRIEGRVDVSSVELLKRLKEAGCFQVSFGIESGSQKMLNIMQKRTTVEQNRQAVFAARDAGIHCVPQFIIGLPCETKETLKETFNFIKSTDFWNTLATHYANAYPGSKIYRNAQDKGLIKDEFAYVSSLSGSNIYTLALADIPFREVRAMWRRFMIIRVFRKNNLLAAIFILANKILRKIAYFLVIQKASFNESRRIILKKIYE